MPTRAELYRQRATECEALAERATTLMKLVIAVLLIAVAANTAALAQYVFDAKGRRYQCLPGDWACSALPPPRARLQPLPEKRRH